MDRRDYSIDSFSKGIQELVDKIISNSMDDRGLSIQEAERRKQRKTKLTEAIKNCGIGDKGAKEIVKQYIADLLVTSLGVNEENINKTCKFDSPKSLSIMEKFNILMIHYKKQYGYDGLTKLINNHKLADLRKIDGEYKYIITNKDIEGIFYKEEIKLCFKDKLEIVSQKIYEKYKGLGVIDEIRDMNIDGLSVGVSGIPKEFLSNAEEIYVNKLGLEFNSFPKSYDSVWLYYQGKEIYMSFLSFESYDELERVCNNVYRYNSPGQLSRDKGFIVNTLADNSRIVVVRPPYAESWAFFIRKLGSEVKLDNMLNGINSDKVIKLEKFLMKGCQNTAITGQQGDGKSTHMIGLIDSIYSMYTLRIWENYFETHLRAKMPHRNILTIQETPTISGEEGLDLLKKTNGAVTIIGEAADDKEVSYVVKTAQVASKFTLFTHHAKNFDALIKAMRNSTLNSGIFRDESVAEDQVISVLDFNIHLSKTPYGKRYLERITECVSVETKDEFPKTLLSGESKMDALMDAALLYFKKSTQQKKYKAVNIVEYDIEKDTYIFKNSISENRIKEIYKNLFEEDKKEFKELLKQIF